MRAVGESDLSFGGLNGLVLRKGFLVGIWFWCWFGVYRVLLFVMMLLSVRLLSFCVVICRIVVVMFLRFSQLLLEVVCFTLVWISCWCVCAPWECRFAFACWSCLIGKFGSRVVVFVYVYNLEDAFDFVYNLWELCFPVLNLVYFRLGDAFARCGL